MELDPARSAVLFIDFHVDVCAPGGRMVSQEPAVLERFGATVDRAAAVLTHLRGRGAQGPWALHVGHGFAPGYPELEATRLNGMSRYVRDQGAFVRGTPGNEFVPPLRPQDGEPVLWKHSISAFVGTDLAGWLTRRSIDTVVVAGVVTHYAVLATALNANDLGYRTLVLTDCCTSADPARHQAALEILAPLTEQLTGADLISVL